LLVASLVASKFKGCFRKRFGKKTLHNLAVAESIAGAIIL